MNRPWRDHRIPAIVATFSALAIAAGLVASPAALAHGHGGPVAVSGPSAAISAPATTFYGGFAQPVYVNRTAYYQAQPSSYVNRTAYYQAQPSSYVNRAAYYQAQPSPPAPAAAAPEQPAATPPALPAATSPNQTTAPAQPVVHGAMGGWGGNWYLAPSPYGYGYSSPGAIIGVQGVKLHQWVPIRFYYP